MTTIVFFSISGNTRAFANRFSEEFRVIPLKEADDIEEDYVLFSPTYNFGEVPAPVKRFLVSNAGRMKAVVSFGNMNWGSNFANAGNVISEEFGVPLLLKVEMRGSSAEYDIIKEKMIRWQN